jgi:DNA-binding Xre family transcriptional regulator
MGTSDQQTGRGAMYVKLKSYLEELEELEQSRPAGQRREVPTLRDLAAAAGIHEVTMSKLVRGKIRSLTFDTGTAILDELHRRGFEADVSDILGYRPPESRGKK